MEHAFLFVTGISDGPASPWSPGPTCDVGLVGYEMARAGRAGRRGPHPRAPGRAARRASAMSRLGRPPTIGAGPPRPARPPRTSLTGGPHAARGDRSADRADRSSAHAAPGAIVGRRRGSALERTADDRRASAPPDLRRRDLGPPPTSPSASPGCSSVTWWTKGCSSSTPDHARLATAPISSSSKGCSMAFRPSDTAAHVPTPTAPRAAAGQDRRRRRLRRRQDDLRRFDLRDRAADHRGRHDQGERGDRRHGAGHRPRRHHGGHGLRPHHARRRPDPLPVRHPRPGPLLVHVGRPGAGRHRCGRAGRHPGSRSASRPSTTSRSSGVPFIVAVNCSTAQPAPPSTRCARRSPSRRRPVILTDARERQSTKTALLELVQHALQASAG